MDLQDFRNDAPDDASPKLADHVGILDNGVTPLCVISVLESNGLAIDLAHEARFHAAMLPVKVDELEADRLLKDVRQEQDRRRGFGAGKAVRRRQLLKIGKEEGCIAAVGREWNDT